MIGIRLPSEVHGKWPAEGPRRVDSKLKLEPKSSVFRNVNPAILYLIVLQIVNQAQRANLTLPKLRFHLDSSRD